MTAYILYNLGTPAEGWAKDFGERLKREQVDNELLDADSPRGIDLAEHYDVLARPAIVLLKDDGAVMGVWQGEETIPPVSEIAYLAHQ